MNVTSAVPQLSEAVNVTASATTSHCTVSSVGSDSLNVGAVVSSIVNVAVVVLVFPQPSVTVNVTVADPVAPQVSDKAVKSLDQEIAEQSSEAEAPALEFNQSCKAVSFPKPSHSTFKSPASIVIVGAILSIIAYVADVVIELPHSSVAVKITSIGAAQSEAEPP